VAVAGCDAITITCTNFAGVDVPAMTATRTPVIDSVAVTIERALDARLPV